MTLSSEKVPILDQLDANSNQDSEDPLVKGLSGIGASLQAVGELRTYFNKLSAAAPEEISEEAEIVAEQYDRQLDDAAGGASDPLGTTVSVIVGGVAVSGQLDALNSFALDNCGESI